MVQSKGNFLSKKTKNFLIIGLISIIAAIFLSFIILIIARVRIIKTDSKSLAAVDESALEEYLKTTYKTERALVKPLPYKTLPVDLPVGAKSAICVDTTNGCILWEKNADEVIPPASTTKMLVMYIVFEELEKGIIKLDDIVPLPKECLAINMMPHSSLMFLGEFQKVTLEQLMTGLCVDSGNDAAYALAFYVIQKENEAHGVEEDFDADKFMARFVGRMNKVAEDLGLTHTHFIESSGYSEDNKTTARELATFCTSYVTRFPQCLKYHSMREFTWSGIFQANTNPLLRIMEGCDGFKTGYIIESGYNLALTVKRNGRRIVCVTLGGQGVGGRQGNAGRIKDNTQMVNYAFDRFANCEIPVAKDLTLPVLYGEKTRLRLSPAYTMKTLPVPNAILKDGTPIKDQIKITLEAPKALAAPIKMGQELAAISYNVGDYILLYIPLVASADLAVAGPLVRAADYFARYLF